MVRPMMGRDGARQQQQQSVLVLVLLAVAQRPADWSVAASFAPARVVRNFFVPQELRAHDDPNSAKHGIRVIGAGPGRTGTDSMWAALNRLGVGPTYHMKECLLEESGIGTEGHMAAFESAAVHESGGPPADLFAGGWGEMLDGFGGGVDYPFSMFFAELAAYFPEAKVVLTVRDGRAWFRSINSTICHFQRPSWFMDIVWRLPTRLRKQVLAQPSL
jgi:hypothetical protein